MAEERKFNVRIYGLLINETNEVLLSHERKGELKFTKFPGGGLDWGEGPLDCLHREFKEELGISLNAVSHFYTTDFYQQSAFDDRDQLLSIYYLVKSPMAHAIADGQETLDEEGTEDHFSWKKIDLLNVEDVTFPIDRHVVRLLKAQAVLP
jgi:ADP-ribose pyrophosphatase YjhB (NUDIX family)